MGRFDVGSFIGGMVIGGIAGAVFVGYNALKLGVNTLDLASKEGWINQAELEKDLARSRMARAYRTRSRPRRRHSRAFAVRKTQDIYGHGVGVDSDLNRIPIFL